MHADAALNEVAISHSSNEDTATVAATLSPMIFNAIVDYYQEFLKYTDIMQGLKKMLADITVYVPSVV